MRNPALACGLLALAFTFNSSANVRAATDVETVKDKKIDDIQTEDGLEVLSGNGTAIISLTRRPTLRVSRKNSVVGNSKPISWQLNSSISRNIFRTYNDSGENAEIEIFDPSVNDTRIYAPIDGLYRLHVLTSSNFVIDEPRTRRLTIYLNLPDVTTNCVAASTSSSDSVRVEQEDAVTGLVDRGSFTRTVVEIDITIPMFAREYLVGCSFFTDGGEGSILGYERDDFLEFRYVGPLPENIQE